MKVKKCYECKLGTNASHYSMNPKVICGVDKKVRSRYSKCTHNYKS